MRSTASVLSSLASVPEPRCSRAVLRPLYRLAIGHHNACVIFQNPDDRKMLQHQLGVDALPATLIRGSGVDLAQYVVREEPPGTPVVTMCARLLRDKGIFEFAEAARLLVERGVAVTCQLAGGPVANGNPAALTDADVATARIVGSPCAARSPLRHG